MHVWMLGILGFIFVMGLAVLVHELGHFVAARKFGVRCHEFAIGMGPALWKKRKGETMHKICAIPIGGYVMMGMDEGERDIIKEQTEIGLTLDGDGTVVKIHVQPADGQFGAVLISNTLDVANQLEIAVEVEGERRVYPVSSEMWYVDSKADREQQIVPSDKRLEKKPKRQRFVIMVAGALMNFVLAYVLLLIVNGALGEVVGYSTQLNAIGIDGPAYEAGLLPGDRILQIGQWEVHDFDGLRQAIQDVADNEATIVFERDGVTHEAQITPMTRPGSDAYYLGIDPMNYRERSLMGTFRSANADFVEFSTLIVSTLRMLTTGEAGAGDLAGFVGIAYMTGQVATQGFFSLLAFAALININLAIFNLLPFPALDGGHITFIVIEAIIGKPVNSKIQNAVSIAGMVLLMGLMVFTVFNDVFRFILN